MPFKFNPFTGTLDYYEAGVPGATGVAGSAGVGMPGQDADVEDPQVIPGPRGDVGSSGVPGVAGVSGVLLMVVDAEVEEPMMIPGPPGTTTTLNNNTTTTNLQMMVVDPENEDLPLIPGPKGDTGATGGGGAGSDPYQGSFAPGSFTIATGKYAYIVKRLQLTGTQQVAVQGTGRLRIG